MYCPLVASSSFVRDAASQVCGHGNVQHLGVAELEVGHDLDELTDGLHSAQTRVARLLAANGRAKAALIVMRGVYDSVVWQHEELRVNGSVQGLRRPALKIHTTAGVPGSREGRKGARAARPLDRLVRHYETIRIGSRSGRDGRLGRLGRALKPPFDLARRGDVVGVAVGVEHEGEPEAELLHQCKVALDLINAWIDQDGLSGRRVSQKVGEGGALGVEQLAHHTPHVVGTPGKSRVCVRLPEVHHGWTTTVGEVGVPEAAKERDRFARPGA
mmetsp:Transcript_25869/g.60489  ORF Transcript_25869/g.60489 Transcript_25869/m.60489 type:complete len:272 (+) Transcript_25869:563-1378(+)